MKAGRCLPGEETMGDSRGICGAYASFAAQLLSPCPSEVRGIGREDHIRGTGRLGGAAAPASAPEGSAWPGVHWPGLQRLSVPAWLGFSCCSAFRAEPNAASHVFYNLARVRPRSCPELQLWRINGYWL